MSTSRSSNTQSLAPTSPTPASRDAQTPNGPWKKPPTTIKVQNPFNTAATRKIQENSRHRGMLPVSANPISKRALVSLHGPISRASTASGSGSGVVASGSGSGSGAKRRKVERRSESELNLQPVEIPSGSDKKGKAKAVPKEDVKEDVIDVDADIVAESPPMMDVDPSSSDELRLYQGDTLPDDEPKESACPPGRKSKFFSLGEDPPSSQEVEYVGTSIPAKQRSLVPIIPNPGTSRVRKTVDAYERLKDGPVPEHIDLAKKQKKKQAMKTAKFTPNVGLVDILSAPSISAKPASKPASRTNNNERQPLDMQPVATGKRRKGTPKPKVTNSVAINDSMYSLRTSDTIPTATSLSWNTATTLLTLRDANTSWEHTFDTLSCQRIQVSTKDCDRKMMDFIFKKALPSPFNQVILLVESGQSEEYAHFCDFMRGKSVSYLNAVASETVLDQGLQDFGDDDDDEPGPSMQSKSAPLPQQQQEGTARLLALRNAPPNPKRKRTISQVDSEIIITHAPDKPPANNVRQPSVVESVSMPLRRTTRNMTRREEPSSPSSAYAAAANKRPRPPKVDPDEIILNYPSGIPGSVNITNADLARLEPGEFLNDTVIEFSLKLWLRELERDNPELASQVHVFNSFFYKKLNIKKEVGYESVKKWTSKFDIFKKKYIIVPINENFHWYLAIIYEPEHMLSPLPPSDSQTTRQTRQTPQKPQSTRTEPLPTTTISIPKTPPPPEAPPDMILTTPNSEAEVERDLADFPNSCSLTDPIEPDDEVTMKEDDRGSDGGLSYLSDPRPRSRSLSASEMRREHEPTPPGPPPSSSSTTKKASDVEPEVIPDSEAEDDIMIVDPPAKPVSVSRSTTATATGSGTNERSASESLEIVEGPSTTAKSEGGVPTARFYGSVKSRMKGKAKAKPPPSSKTVVDLAADEPVEIHSTTDSGDEEPAVSAVPQTYIFTLDSLGSRHPQATKKLSRYLQLEALDKKGITVTREAKGKFPAVPSQPNFCDCGIYVLHFVETFMKNPVALGQLMITKSAKFQAKPDHQRLWNHEAVGHKRADLAARVLELSALWKEEQRKKAAETETANKSEEDPEDDEVLVIHASPPPGGGKKGHANRLR